jgi:hypothetical protein
MRKPPTARLDPLTVAQFMLLHVLHSTRRAFTPAELARAIETRFPELGVAALGRLVARSLARLNVEGVLAELVDDEVSHWSLRRDLPAETRAALLLSKPPKDARNVPRRPRKNAAGQAPATGGAVSAAPAAPSAPALPDAPAVAPPADLDSQAQGAATPAVEVVAVVAPRRGGAA